MKAQNPSRRQFLGSVSKMLGGAAVAGLAPNWAYAVARTTDQVVTRSFWSMGTLINLSVRTAKDDVSTFTDAFGVLADVDAALSAHNPQSELSVLNGRAGSWQKASRQMLQVASASVRLGNLTDGALDVTVLPYLRSLGFMPTLGQTYPADFAADFTQLRVRQEEVRIGREGYAVDFGGIAKGFAVDDAIEALRAGGAKAALLEAGGDLVAIGRPAPSRRWTIGIRSPENPASICARLEVEDEAIATSGIYAQPHARAGQTPGHIVDPRSGKPVNHVVSASVVTSSAMDADALATAVSVMPQGEGQRFIESLPQTEAMFIYANGDVHLTPGLRSRVHFV